MTGIRFDFNVADRIDYACRLLRKAWHRGSPIAVRGDHATLAAIELTLWRMQPTDFVPHARSGDAASIPTRLHASTVWLAAEADTSPVHGTLVNIGAGLPRGFESFERLIELVSTAEDDRLEARERWRAYARRGYDIERHEVVTA